MNDRDAAPSAAAPAPAPAPAPGDAAFPVDWPDPHDAKLGWLHDDVHCPRPITPLTFSCLYHEGFDAAACAIGLGFRFFARRINTYYYYAVGPRGPVADPAAQAAADDQRVAELAPHLWREWTHTILPEVQRHHAWWDEQELPSMPLPQLLAHYDETRQRMARLWQLHGQLLYPWFYAQGRFLQLCDELFPGQSSTSWADLLGGLDSDTSSAAALWELSREVAATAPLAQMFQSTPPRELYRRLLASPEHAAFAARLGEYLQTHGRFNIGTFELATPSWTEDPTPALTTIAEYASCDAPPYAAAEAQASARRAALTLQTRELLAGHPEAVRAQYERYLVEARGATRVSEAHHPWIDARGMFCVRRVIVQLAQRLVTAGTLADARDVFYLSADELRELATRPDGPSPAATIAARRAEMARFGRGTPPPFLGTPGGDTGATGRAVAEFFGLAPPRAQSGDGEQPLLTGHPGSGGLARGVARVLRDLSEAERLAPGEVLVTRSTLPAWTPVMARAAAIVTDKGGTLCHAAVVARELGVPAVVGAQRATAAIADGQLVEVDGTGGTVRLLQRRMRRSAGRAAAAALAATAAAGAAVSRRRPAG